MINGQRRVKFTLSTTLPSHIHNNVCVAVTNFQMLYISRTSLAFGRGGGLPSLVPVLLLNGAVLGAGRHVWATHRGGAPCWGHGAQTRSEPGMALVVCLSLTNAIVSFWFFLEPCWFSLQFIFTKVSQESDFMVMGKVVVMERIT